MRYTVPMKEIMSRLTVGISKHPTTQPLLGAMSSIVGYAETLEGLIINRSPRDTEEGHAMKVFDAAGKIEKKLKNDRELIQQRIGNIRADLNQQMDRNSSLTPTANAAEIRSILRSMDHSERLNVITEAVDAGDTEVLAAIASGSKLLTGLDDNVKAKFLNIYRERSDPGSYEALQNLAEYERQIPRLADLATKAVREAYNPSYIADLQKIEEKSNAAQSQFKAVIGE